MCVYTGLGGWRPRRKHMPTPIGNYTNAQLWSVLLWICLIMTTIKIVVLLFDILTNDNTLSLNITYEQSERQWDRQMLWLTASVCCWLQSSAETCPLESDELHWSVFNVIPQPSTNVDNEWKCVSRMSAWVSSDRDQLSLPWRRLCHTHAHIVSSGNSCSDRSNSWFVSPVNTKRAYTHSWIHYIHIFLPVSYTHLTLPTKKRMTSARCSPRTAVKAGRSKSEVAATSTACLRSLSVS